jgi:hypothetical protein
MTAQISNGVRDNQSEITKTIRDNAVALQAVVSDLKATLGKVVTANLGISRDHAKALH